MKNLLWLVVLTGGCIEYEPASTFPPAGANNAAPLKPTKQTDKLVQVTSPQVDILWVIDNSCSMADDQTRLAQNFPLFMDFFLGSGLDYHIGLTSTDYGASGGRLRPIGGETWITPESLDPTNAFADAAQMGSSGSATEKGRDPAYAALEIETAPGMANEGFVRDAATLHLVTISDEDDDSTLIGVPEFSNYLNTLKPEDDDVTYSAIITPSPIPAGCSNGIESGYDYLAVQSSVGGILWSICDPDWTELLVQLGMQAAGLKREYFLSQLPVPGSIKVWVLEDGTRFDFEEDVDWTYNQTRNSVLFEDFVPSALSEVYVKYELLGASDAVP